MTKPANMATSPATIYTLSGGPQSRPSAAVVWQLERCVWPSVAPPWARGVDLCGRC